MNVPSCAVVVDQRLGLGVAAVVDGDAMAVAGEVAGEVAAHHGQAGDTDLREFSHVVEPLGSARSEGEDARANVMTSGARSATRGSRFGHSACSCGCVRRSRSSGVGATLSVSGGDTSVSPAPPPNAELGGVAPCCSRWGFRLRGSPVHLLGRLGIGVGRVSSPSWTSTSPGGDGRSPAASCRTSDWRGRRVLAPGSRCRCSPPSRPPDCRRWPSSMRPRRPPRRSRTGCIARARTTGGQHHGADRPEAIVETRWSMCEEAVKEICAFDKPPYVQSRQNASRDRLSVDTGVAGARSRLSTCVASTTPGSTRTG